MGSEDTTWVFDSLVGYLQGPIWNIPILTFMEQKSSVFEPANEELEEEYRKIHEEYKNLVDTMLGTFVDDIGITTEQFEEACSKTPNEGVHVRFHKTLFEQVWAANDYEIFKRIMLQKNLELQLQALELIQQRCGVTSQALLPPDGDEVLHTEEEARIMEEVIKKSLEEYEASKQLLDDSTLQLEQSLSSPEEHQRLEAECRREKELLQTALQNSIDSSSNPSGTETEKTPEESESEPVQSEVDPEELARRQAYLKSQRDKLLALKKQEREKQLREAEVTITRSRPRSARAAQSALAGEADVNSKTLKARKALAERLRSEVVGRI
ncbi:cilia- and flagella-associated protein 36 [Anabrus simplex]|uniref:cilia- and flagella-associated protein 36 n=1 Tax=Anabrus simplex TaxID=316456 RepID=UPI0034DD624A